MSFLYRLAAAGALVLVGAKHFMPAETSHIPQDHLAQAGLFFGTAFVVDETVAASLAVAAWLNKRMGRRRKHRQQDKT